MPGQPSEQRYWRGVLLPDVNQRKLIRSLPASFDCRNASFAVANNFAELAAPLPTVTPTDAVRWTLAGNDDHDRAAIS